MSVVQIAGDQTGDIERGPIAKVTPDGELHVIVTGGGAVGLTDTQLRATPVPVADATAEATLALIKAKTDNLDVALSTRAVTGLTDAQLRATPVPVSGPATDAQLRATPVPVSSANLDVALSTRTKPSDQQHAIVDSSALPSGAAVSSKQDSMITGLAVLNSLVPAVFDYIALGYTGDDLTTVVYKTGGASGTVVSTLTLAYTASVLQSVTRT